MPTRTHYIFRSHPSLPHAIDENSQQDLDTMTYEDYLLSQGKRVVDAENNDYNYRIICGE